jgi:hypothetical protein
VGPQLALGVGRQTGSVAPGRWAWIEGRVRRPGQAAGTAPPGGGSAASPSPTSTRRTAWGSVTAPRIRRRPPQRSHTRISIANTRWSNRAQGHRLEDRSAAAARVSAGAGGGTIAARHWARGPSTPW